MLNTEQFNQIIKLSFVEKVEPVIKIKTSKDKTEENNLGKANNTKSTKLSIFLTLSIFWFFYKITIYIPYMSVERHDCKYSIEYLGLTY